MESELKALVMTLNDDEFTEYIKETQKIEKKYEDKRANDRLLYKMSELEHEMIMAVTKR